MVQQGINLSKGLKHRVQQTGRILEICGHFWVNDATTGVWAEEFFEILVSGYGMAPCKTVPDLCDVDVGFPQHRLIELLVSAKMGKTGMKPLST